MADDSDDDDQSVNREEDNREEDEDSRSDSPPPAPGSLIARGRAFLPTKHWKDTQEAWVKQMKLDNVKHDPQYDAMFINNAEPSGVKTDMVRVFRAWKTKQRELAENIIKHSKLDQKITTRGMPPGGYFFFDRNGKKVTAPNHPCFVKKKALEKLYVAIENLEAQMRSGFERVGPAEGEYYKELAAEFKQQIGLPEGVGRRFTERLFEGRTSSRLSSSDTSSAIEEYRPVDWEQPGSRETFYELSGRRDRGQKREPHSEAARPGSTAGRKKMRLLHNPAVEATLARVFAASPSGSGRMPPLVPGSLPVSSSSSSSSPVSSSSSSLSPVSSSSSSSAPVSVKIEQSIGSRNREVDATCRICKDDIGDVLYKEVRSPQLRLAEVTCCGAPFHRKCIQTWWDACRKQVQISRCPNCRKISNSFRTSYLYGNEVVRVEANVKESNGPKGVFTVFSHRYD
eukprot:g80876.t1